MAKKKVFNRYYTTRDISKELGYANNSAVEHLVRRGVFPKPKVNITYMRYIGEHKRPYNIRLWNGKQLERIKKIKSKLTRGRYKGGIHPTKKVDSKELS